MHAADVAKAAALLLTAPVKSITGEAFNCYDRYISKWDVAHLAREISGSGSEIRGTQTSPKHQIRTEKLRRLGMEFGGADLLRQTVQQLVSAVEAP